MVRDMTETVGWKYLVDRASLDVGSKQERVLGGQLTDLGDYKRLTGWVEGALFVLTLPNRLEDELKAARERNAEDSDAA